MKLIAFVFVLSVLAGLNARALKENPLLETLRCGTAHDDLYICRITAPIARLVIDPSRTMKIFKDALASIKSTFSIKEVTEAFLGAMTVPLSAAIHSPKLIKMTIEEIDGHIIPQLKSKLKELEGKLKEAPLGPLKWFAIYVPLLPPYALVQASEGIYVALAQSGFPRIQKIFMSLHKMGKKFVDLIAFSILRFKCTDVFHQSICDQIFFGFESRVVRPAFNVVHGLMEVAEKTLGKVKESVFPILDRLSPSNLKGYCKKLLSEEACKKLFFYIDELDHFGSKEIVKVGDFVLHVIQWISKHILTGTMLELK